MKGCQSGTSNDSAHRIHKNDIARIGLIKRATSFLAVCEGPMPRASQRGILGAGNI